jgi:hypothetical protein
MTQCDLPTTTTMIISRRRKMLKEILLNVIRVAVVEKKEAQKDFKTPMNSSRCRVVWERKFEIFLQCFMNNG